MHQHDKQKTIFIMEDANYYTKIMPFGLKNVGATYQRLMDQIFHKLPGKNIEIYMDDMVVKLDSTQLVGDLKEVLSNLTLYNIRLNPKKCIFEVDKGNFLSVMLTHKGIEVNSDKFRALIKMKCLKNLKEVQQFVGRLTYLSRFMPKLDPCQS